MLKCPRPHPDLPLPCPQALVALRRVLLAQFSAFPFNGADLYEELKTSTAILSTGLGRFVCVLGAEGVLGFRFLSLERLGFSSSGEGGMDGRSGLRILLPL